MQVSDESGERPPEAAAVGSTARLRRILEEAVALLADTDLPVASERDQLADLLGRLTAERFHLAVLGQFKRGKSTLLNALLGEPLLANIYLHDVLDLWFEKGYAKSCRGKAHLVRFADDFIACFEDEGDARRFMEVLKERLAKFSLEVAPEKTAMLRFGSRAAQECHRDGLRRPKTFQFLGLTHFVTRSRRGRFVVGRKTDGNRSLRNYVYLGACLNG